MLRFKRNNNSAMTSTLILLSVFHSLTAPLELMLSRTCPVVLREIKHHNPIILLLFFIGFDELEHLSAEDRLRKMEF